MSGDFYARVYAIVRQVPFGRVTTYGSVALALGRPHWARQVGWALAGLPDEHADEVPAHRVILASGGLSPGFANGVPGVQRAMLEAEGIEFDAAGRVSLARYLWEPGD
ncbi:MAG: MGMT family protein [Chloroflexi bacterium]|nr:MGMT family protein [Chloroflexota bacterium]